MVRVYKRISHRKKWSKTSLAAAIDAVKFQGMPVNRASATYGIPRHTLGRYLHLSEQELEEQVMGRYGTVFTVQQERELVNYIVAMEERFYGITSAEVRSLAYHIADRNGMRHRFDTSTEMAGFDWMSGFRQRHPELSLRCPKQILGDRATHSIKRITIDDFYRVLGEEVFDSEKFRPGQVKPKVKVVEKLIVPVGPILSSTTITTATRSGTPPQAMPCSIPGCCNLLQEWTTEFLRDEELLERWKAAILVGTGQSLAGESVRNGAQVCDMHFSVEQRNGIRNEYLEPSLFVRDKILLQVTSCSLCLRYDTIDTMFDKEYCLAQGQSLQRLVNKYYKIAPLGKESEEAGYFCESCTIRIDMTHSFWQELSEGAKESRKLLKKMQKEKPVLMNPTPGTIEIKQEVLSTGDVQHEGDFMGDIIVKEETQLEELDPGHLVVTSEFDYVTPVFDGQEESSDGSQDGQTFAENNVPNLFRCYICSINLETKQTLIQHLVAGHPAEQSYRCDECKLSFNQITGYNIHLSKHDTRRPFKCTFCSVRFNRDMARKSHEASKHGIDHGKLNERDRVRKRQTCPTCGRTCASKVALTRHELIQHGTGSGTVQQNDYKCEICSKSFATVRNLERHLKIHRNEKPFKCEQCDASFRRNDQLRIHERLHTGEKPLVCPGCGEGFAASFSLFRHKKQCPAMQVQVPDTSGEQEARQ